MNYIFKIIGAIIGFKFGGFFGGLFGLWLGHKIDKKLDLNNNNISHEEKQRFFYDATFLVMGNVAKADGVVSQQEINQAKQVMQRFGLNSTQTKQAQELFNQGKEDDFDLDEILVSFRNIVGPRNSLAMMFLEIQISAALADGVISTAEKIILLKVCDAIGVPAALFEQMIGMMSAAGNFKNHGNTHSSRGSYGQTQNAQPSLAQAYQVLGAKETDSDSIVKKCYRKLMSEHHPDKLQAKGLPEEMLKMAQEKTHSIKKAYDIIKAHRGFK